MTARPVDYDDYAATLVPLAAQLIGAVRYEGHPATRRIFDQLRRTPAPTGVHPAEALAVILAAMVDDTRSPNELLAWVDATHITDHALGDLTPREAHAEQRRLRRHDKPCPGNLREQVNAYRREDPTVDSAVDRALEADTEQALYAQTDAPEPPGRPARIQQKPTAA